jgi:hypothetical protein
VLRRANRREADARSHGPRQKRGIPKRCLSPSATIPPPS